MDGIFTSFEVPRLYVSESLIICVSEGEILMKKALRKLFWPILTFFEGGGEEFVYQPSHRTILMAVGVLFTMLSGASVYLTTLVADKGVYIPLIVFLAVGLTCLIVASLGSDRAISNIWKSKK